MGQLYQTITYRLADVLPIAVAKRLNSELDGANVDAAYRQRIEAYLDAGHGECLLRRPEFAQLVLDTWGHFDAQRYHVCAWVIMPNHVHILIWMRDRSLSETVKGWKSFTSRQMNALLGRKGQRWQEDYWDRFIRNNSHYEAAVAYIHHNPVRAGLVSQAEQWPWSSLGARTSSSASSTHPATQHAGEDTRAPKSAKLVRIL